MIVQVYNVNTASCLYKLFNKSYAKYAHKSVINSHQASVKSLWSKLAIAGILKRTVTIADAFLAPREHTPWNLPLVKTLVLWGGYTTFIEVHDDNELSMILNGIIGRVETLAAMTFSKNEILKYIQKTWNGKVYTIMSDFHLWYLSS